MSEQPRLRQTARTFIASAFDALKADHVIPTPSHYPYVTVGRDYFGQDIMPLAEYQALESQLNETYPERFSEPLKRRHHEFPSIYIFSFLEACVARCSRNHKFDADSPSVDESINEFLAVLEASSYEVVCCRHVSHLTTVSGNEEIVGNIVIVPEPEGFGGLTDRIQREIRGAARGWNRDDPRPYDPPHSLLIARQTTDTADPYAAVENLSRQLERFLLISRLLTAGTVQSTYEVSGTTTLVTRLSPHMQEFQEPRTLLVRRAVRLGAADSGAYDALGKLIDAADVKREGMVATSFDVALGKFNRSYRGGSPFENLVDLATALEATLLGGEKETEGLTLRLRARVAALLVTDEDSAQSLFSDVGQLYGLRSKLVHGGQIKERDLRKVIARISTVPADDVEHKFGIALGHAIDRMRDLVRRAILARLCLAAEPEPLWPFTGETLVDAILADDVRRAEWRMRWHSRLASLGAEGSALRPRSAVDFLSPEDR
ncbi:HEPN domain-containing protein [Streptomyces parvulus]|uniref:HEPN domain-containing protein n=1 Tax=Streptomyces parvulus TaxID=146923 RepID=UPI001CFA7C90|nr:HEPN domain-containing protein [Streptomyces parvulus]